MIWIQVLEGIIKSWHQTVVTIYASQLEGIQLAEQYASEIQTKQNIL